MGDQRRIALPRGRATNGTVPPFSFENQSVQCPRIRPEEPCANVWGGKTMTDLRLSLSKKGFDSTNGRGPSPILADGRMVPLPIPEPRPGVRAATYGGLAHDDGTYAELLARLGYRIAPGTAAHLDPDIVREARARDRDWRGMFGQVDRAASHLANQGVGSGSLFLFWGWYEHVSPSGAMRRSKGFSALFGYLEVDCVLDVGSCKIPSFGTYHPHFARQYPRVRNRIYVARKRLSWNPLKPGWGVFAYHPRLRLSIDGMTRTRWRLPGCFLPSRGCILSHNDPGKWTTSARYADVQVPDIGQEFVCRLTPQIAAWAYRLIDKTPIWSPKRF
jgi:hypothetical protein